jgi:hypothetical protein
VHRVRKFVEVSTERVGYAMTAAALSEVSNGATWNPDPSFSVAEAILDDPEFASLLRVVFEGRPCHGVSPEGQRGIARFVGDRT